MMLRNLLNILFALTILFSSSLLSAQKRYNVKDIESTLKKHSSEYQLPQIYSVAEFNSVEIVKGDLVKKKSKKHELLQNKITQLDTIKSKFEKIYNDKLQKYNDINEISMNVKKFLNSEETYDDKKHLLKEAQLNALLYNIDLLIYADAVINKKNRSKFLILTFDKLDLKVHLYRQLKKMNEIKNEKPVNEFLEEEKLAELKEQLESTPAHYYIRPNKKKLIKALLIDKQISYKKFHGGFVNIGNCYILTETYSESLKEHQIIKEKDLKSLKININKLNFQKKTLLRLANSNSHFIVDSDFLTKFAKEI